MRGSRNFRQVRAVNKFAGFYRTALLKLTDQSDSCYLKSPGQSDKKISDNVFFFFFFFFSPQLIFNRSQMVTFKEIYHFSRFQRGSNFFQGGGGGGPIAYSYRNPYNL